MKRRIAIAVAALAVIAWAMPAASAIAPSAQWDPQPDDPKIIAQAMQDVQKCLGEPDSSLAVFYLIDASGSIASTDEENLRIDALESSIAPLSQLPDRSHPVQIAAGTFNSTYEDVELAGANSDGWLELTSGNTSSIARDLATKIQQVTPNGATNWLAGIEGAQKALSAQAQSQKGAPNCQMLVWITDGGIQVSNPEIPTEDADAIRALCGVEPTTAETALPSGNLFQLRDSGVIILGLLLFSEKYALDMGEEGYLDLKSRVSYFKSVVEGKGTVYPYYFNNSKAAEEFDCGEVVPGAQGAQILTTNAQQLANKFTQMFECIVRVCTDGPDVINNNPDWTFWVPRGVSSLTITSTLDSVVRFGNTPWCDNAHPCDRTRLGDSETIRITDFGGHYDAEWTLTPRKFDPNDKPNYRYYVDIQVIPDVALTVESGQAATWSFSAKHGDQAANLDKSFVTRDLTAIAKIPGDPPLKLQLDRDGDTWSLDPQSEFLPSQSGQISTELTLTANGRPGEDPIVFQPVQASFNFTVTLPPGLPSITTPAEGNAAAFTTLEGPNGEAKTQITVTGNAEKDGRACFQKPDVSDDAEPSRVGSYQWSWSPALDADGCLAIRAGEVIDLELTVSNPQQFAATVKGSLPITLASASDTSKTYPSNRDFILPTTTVKNAAVLWGVIVALMILGVAIPYILLIFFARRQARFGTEYDGARWAALPVVLGSGGIPRITEIPPLDYKYVFFDGSSAQREIEVGPTKHAISPPRLWPFREPAVTVTSSDSTVVVSNEEGVPSKLTSSARSSLQLSHVFYFVTERPQMGISSPTPPSTWGSDEVVSAPSAGDFLGHVYVLVAGYNLQDGVSRSTSEVRNWALWPQIHDALRELRNAPPVGAPTATDPASGKTNSDGSTDAEPADDDW